MKKKFDAPEKQDLRVADWGSSEEPSPSQTFALDNVISVFPSEFDCVVLADFDIVTFCQGNNYKRQQHQASVKKEDEIEFCVPGPNQVLKFDRCLPCDVFSLLIIYSVSEKKLKVLCQV